MNDKIKAYCLMYLKIAMGSAIFAFGFQFFTYPNAIVAGGITGISMILNYLFDTPVGVMTIIINIPLFAISWRRFGTGFLVTSLAGMILSSAFVDLFSLIDYVATDNILLATVFGGVIKGVGLGIVYSTSATTGGVDIIAKFLRLKYQHINFGTLILFLDVVVIAAFAVIFKSYESAMYAVICMYINSKAVDTVLSGGVSSKVCYVISDESGRLKDAITDKLRRGVTFLHGEGAWSGKEKDIILCVIKSSQIVELKKIVKSVDENAFVISCDSREVFGNGFTNIAIEG